MDKSFRPFWRTGVYKTMNPLYNINDGCGWRQDRVVLSRCGRAGSARYDCPQLRPIRGEYIETQDNETVV